MLEQFESKYDIEENTCPMSKSFMSGYKLCHKVKVVWCEISRTLIKAGCDMLRWHTSNHFERVRGTMVRLAGGRGGSSRWGRANVWSVSGLGAGRIPGRIWGPPLEC